MLLLAEAGGDLGVVGAVPNTGALPGGQLAAIVQAETPRPGRAAPWSASAPAPFAEVELLADERPTPRVEAAARELRVVLEEIAKLRGSRRLPEILRTIAEPGALVDAVTAWSDAEQDHQAAVLRTVDVEPRVALATALGQGPPRRAAGHRADPRRRHRGDRQAAARVPAAPAAHRRSARSSARATTTSSRSTAPSWPSAELPEKAFNAVSKEIDRLERTSQQSPEHAWIRTWLDRIFEMPWNVRTDDRLDLGAAREVLDADHYGLDDVKDRIVEFLAVRKLRHDRDVARHRRRPTGRPARS